MNKTSFAMRAHAEGQLQVAHLSNEQVDDHLIGDLDATGAAHLAECGECAERVIAAFEPMATFRDVTISWSERRSATMPIPVVQGDAVIWQRRARWAMTACALVVGVSFVSNGHRADMLRVSEQGAPAASVASLAVSVPTPIQPQVEGAATGDAAARYSGDNRMLKAIDSELDASVETPAAMGMETGSGQARSQSAPSSVQD